MEFLTLSLFILRLPSFFLNFLNNSCCSHPYNHLLNLHGPWSWPSEVLVLHCNTRWFHALLWFAWHLYSTTAKSQKTCIYKEESQTSTDFKGFLTSNKGCYSMHDLFCPKHNQYVLKEPCRFSLLFSYLVNAGLNDILKWSSEFFHICVLVWHCVFTSQQVPCFHGLLSRIASE